MLSSHYRWLFFVILITLMSIWLLLPDTPTPNFLLRGGNENLYEECVREQLSDPERDCSEYEPDFDFSLGLDIVGGLRVLLQAEIPSDSFTIEELRETANSVDRRVNALGLSEATVQVQGSNRILVELPGVTDPDLAIATIQQTALLEFVDFGGLGARALEYEGRRVLTDRQAEIDAQRIAMAAEQGPEAEAQAIEEIEQQNANKLRHPSTGQPFATVMTGAGLQAAAAEFDGREWLIRFDLTNEGGAVFGPFTGARIGEPMAIVLDSVVLSSPTIQARLDTGGVITGRFGEEEAKQLALQLRSGSLAIPLRVESAEQVGATLGQESVERSVRAGIVGVVVVLTFMLVYYRLPGFCADLALLVFIVLNMALFKLIPITLTLPAITGFLISVGAAVDGNILIFERFKEELRAGKELREALDAGFDRAWSSIRDSNLSTIIICGILFLFGQTPGASIVSGFALTLAMGLILNLFTAVLVTRTFLYVVIINAYKTIEQRRALLGA